MSNWRVILTDTERLTGVAPECPSRIDRNGSHPSTDAYDVYDCCPSPHIECWSESDAEDVRIRLDRAGAELRT